ncbi:MAG: MFS transporter [Deltaproteobacteria bacterium]|nr:MFS transporter [Deltaproteobacteria bacterium]
MSNVLASDSSVDLVARKRVTTAILFGMFAAAIEMTIVSTAMPRVAGDLGGSDRYAWVLSSYLLASTISAPLFGKLADLIGRRPAYLSGMALFLLGSWTSGAAWSMDALIVARGLQGIGGGALATVGLTIIGDLYPPEERGKVQGLFSAVWGFAGALGPVAGGLIVDFLSWRWVFYLNLPFGLIAMILLALSLREEIEKKPVSIDWLGALLLGGSVIALQLGAGAHGVAGLGRAPLLVSAVALVLFYFVEKRAKEPIVPLGLFAQPTIVVSVAITLLLGMTMLAVTNYVPLFVQGAQGASTRESGLVMTPFAVAWPVAGFSVGMLLNRVGYRRSVVLGCALIVTSAIALTFLRIDSSRGWVLVAMALLGLGMGLQNTPLLIALQSAVPWSQRGSATAMFSFSRTLGNTLGAVFAGAIAEHALVGTAVTSATIDQALRPGAPLAPLAVRQALSGSVHAVLLINVVVALAALAFATRVPKVVMRSTVPLPPAPTEHPATSPDAYSESPKPMTAPVSGSGPH